MGNGYLLANVTDFSFSLRQGLLQSKLALNSATLKVAFNPRSLPPNCTLGKQVCATMLRWVHIPLGKTTNPVDIQTLTKLSPLKG